MPTTVQYWSKTKLQPMQLLSKVSCVTSHCVGRIICLGLGPRLNLHFANIFGATSLHF